jgi:hypothetical protein
MQLEEEVRPAEDTMEVTVWALCRFPSKIFFHYNAEYPTFSLNAS